MKSSRLSSMSSIGWLGSLLLLLLPLTIQAAANQTLEAVACPSTLTTFIATTRMIFEALDSTDISTSTPAAALTADEMSQLTPLLRSVYNGLAESKCDSYFRRIQSMELLEMTSASGGIDDSNNSTSMMNTSVIISEANGMGNEDERAAAAEEEERDINSFFSRRQRQLQDIGNDINSTDTLELSSAATSVLYEVTGSCRDCPVSDSGTFELYDDAFRRELVVLNGKGGQRRTLRVRHSTTRILSSTTTTRAGWTADEQPPADCQCVQGQLPDQPAAPGVQECVNLMNVELQALRSGDDSSSGLFETLQLADLLQLDDLSESDGDTSSTFVDMDTVDVQTIDQGTVGVVEEAKEEDTLWAEDDDDNVDDDGMTDVYSNSTNATAINNTTTTTMVEEP